MKQANLRDIFSKKYQKKNEISIKNLPSSQSVPKKEEDNPSNNQQQGTFPIDEEVKLVIS